MLRPLSNNYVSLEDPPGPLLAPTPEPHHALALNMHDGTMCISHTTSPTLSLMDAMFVSLHFDVGFFFLLLDLFFFFFPSLFSAISLLLISFS